MLCAEDEQSRTCWMTACRLLKVGPRGRGVFMCHPTVTMCACQPRGRCVCVNPWSLCVRVSPEVTVCVCEPVVTVCVCQPRGRCVCVTVVTVCARRPEVTVYITA